MSHARFGGKNAPSRGHGKRKGQGWDCLALSGNGKVPAWLEQNEEEEGRELRPKLSPGQFLEGLRHRRPFDFFSNELSAKYAGKPGGGSDQGTHSPALTILTDPLLIRNR